MKDVIKKYPVLSFLVLNYLISWSFLYPSYQMILENEGITPLSLIGLIGAYGPTIAAIIVQSLVSKSGLKPLLRRLVQVKAGLPVYVFVIFFPIIAYLVSHVSAAIIFGGDLSASIKAGFSGIFLWFLLALPFGPMGEELGWRGFMLPRLMEKFSAIQSSLIVGLAWGVWHLASFTFPGAAIPTFLPVSAWTIGLYFVNTMALSLIFTYVHLKSRGSVFIAILLHAFFNAASNIAFDFFVEPEDFQLLFIPYVLNMLLAAIVGILLIRRSNQSA